MFFFPVLFRSQHRARDRSSGDSYPLFSKLILPPLVCTESSPLCQQRGHLHQPVLAGRGGCLSKSLVGQGVTPHLFPARLAASPRRV